MVSSVIGAVVGGASSLVGTKRQADAAKRAAALQQRQYQQSRADAAPWRDAGVNALAELVALYGLAGAAPQLDALERFRAAPDYRFRLSQGLDAIERSAAARGLLLSGRQLKAISDHAQSVAAGEYASHVNRLAALAGIGQTAAAHSSALGADAVRQAGNATMQAARAQSQGVSGVGNAIAAALAAYQKAAANRKAGEIPIRGGTPATALFGSYDKDFT